MKWVTPSVFLLAHSVPDVSAAREWVEEIGFSPDTVDSGKALSGPEELIAWAGKRCYNSFDVGENPNLTRVRKDWDEYFENLLASGHGSVLEHASFTFAIEGVSRIFTGEMNRHRAGVAISEGSMRYIRYNIEDGLPIVLPPSLRGDTNERMIETAKIMEEAIEDIEKHYGRLNALWKDSLESGDFTTKKILTSLFRRILPMGIATGGVWSFNLRALRHMITMRCNAHAEEEICEVAFKMAALASSVLNVGLRDFEVIDGKFLSPKYVKV